jgi:hypothetical protein
MLVLFQTTALLVGAILILLVARTFVERAGAELFQSFHSKLTLVGNEALTIDRYSLRIVATNRGVSCGSANVLNYPRVRLAQFEYRL